MLNNLSLQLTAWKSAFTRKGRQHLKTKVKPGRSDFLIYFHCQKWFLPTIWLYSCKGEWIKRQPAICPWWLGYWAPRIVQTGICSKHHLTREKLGLPEGWKQNYRKETDPRFILQTHSCYIWFVFCFKCVFGIDLRHVYQLYLQRVWDYEKTLRLSQLYLHLQSFLHLFLSF